MRLSGNIHVCLWISLCGNIVHLISRSFMPQKSHSFPPLSSLVLTPCLPFTRSYPSTSLPTFAFKSPVITTKLCFGMHDWSGEISEYRHHMLWILPWVTSSPFSVAMNERIKCSDFWRKTQSRIHIYGNLYRKCKRENSQDWNIKTQLTWYTLPCDSPIKFQKSAKISAK